MVQVRECVRDASRKGVGYTKAVIVLHLLDYEHSRYLQNNSRATAGHLLWTARASSQNLMSEVSRIIIEQQTFDRSLRSFRLQDP